ncbi:MAG: ferritin family protein [Bacillota bacterium]
MTIACGNNKEGFSVENIVGLAVKIEQAGKKFYSSLAIQEVNQPVQDLFAYLASEEGTHIKSFENLTFILKDEGLNACDGEYMEYLDAIIGSHIFFQQDPDDLERIETVREALEMAIRFERDSIMVFNDLMPLVGEKGKEVLRNLIIQEQVHIRKLAHAFGQF